MKINVIETDGSIQVELIAESPEDKAEILKLVTHPATADREFLSFPRTESPGSVKIEVND
jgi:hypothetical protein